MGYLIFKGKHINTVPGAYVAVMPSHKRAMQRLTEYYIKGRDGALHVNEGYSNFEITATIVLINARSNSRQLLNNWASGTGKLITSDDLSIAYIATVEQEIEWSRIKANQGFYDTADITFNCQPYMVEARDTRYELTASGSIYNKGTMTAYPLIEVRGSGDASFVVAGSEISIDGMEANKPVFIDCETGYIWSEDGAVSVIGDIPSLGVGSNNITIGQNVAKLIITPRWRWI